MSYTHVTAPTQYVEAGEVGTHTAVSANRGAFRWCSWCTSAVGSTGRSAVTDGLAANREVILFDYAGVAGSSGEVPETFEAFGDDSAEVIRALGISGRRSRLLHRRLYRPDSDAAPP